MTESKPLDVWSAPVAELVLGPLLRYVDDTSATVWVETDRPCTVRVLDAESPTFTVHGHHFALVDVLGLEPGSSTPYEVHLDGARCWPDPALKLPASRIRTLDPSRPFRLVFGSCRTAVPHDDEHNKTHGFDTLRAFGHRLEDVSEAEWPDSILFLGDQVYADEPSDIMKKFIEAKRGLDDPPGEELADFEEYAKVYQLAWSDPANRWLLSTIPSMMIFDDHDIRDDWNTSIAWRRQIAALSWWHDRIVGGLGSYWVYQHAGNLSIADRSADPFYAAIKAADGDAGAVVDEFADLADKYPERNRWSYSRDIGKVRLVVLDSRCGRVLRPGIRKVLDDTEWAWFDDLAQGGIDHLLIGTSLPYLLPRGLHEMEYWNEEVGDGRWGKRAAKFAETVRQAVDLEHWAAFHDSFDLMADVVTELSTGHRGPAPASIVFLSGDVHYSYLMRAETVEDRRPGTRDQHSAIFQATCSPIRNPLSRVMRYANTFASFGIAGVLGRLLARSAGLHEQALRWKLVQGPKFNNALATLDLDGRRAKLRWETAKLEPGEDLPDVVEIAAVDLVP